MSILNRIGAALTPFHLSYLGVLTIVICLGPHFKAPVSIAMGLIGAGALWELVRTRKFELLVSDRQGVLMTLWFVLSLVSFCYTANMALGLNELRMKLVFLCLPLAINVVPTYSKRNFHILAFIFILVQTLVAVPSVVTYLLDFEASNLSIRRNKPIHIVTGASHIYFSVGLAFSIFMGIGMWVERVRLWSRYDRYIILLLVILNVASLHIFTSRTGLLAFYAGLGGTVLYFLYRRRAYLWGILILVLLLSSPFIWYHTIPSFRHRMDVTMWDLKQYREGNDLTHCSASIRLVAWESAWNIFKESPLMGVGMGDVEEEMERQYVKNQVLIREGSRPGSPHNQYIEWLVGYGLIGLIISLLILLYPLIFSTRKKSLLLVSFLLLFMAAMLTESFLERQSGIVFYIFFLLFLRKYSEAKDEESHEKP